MWSWHSQFQKQIQTSVTDSNAEDSDMQTLRNVFATLNFLVETRKLISGLIFADQFVVFFVACRLRHSKS